MATSRIQTLVTWYDSSIFWYSGVLCSLCRVLLHILNTCNTNTRVRCSLQNSLISEIWWQFLVFRCWYRDMIPVSFHTLVFCAVYTASFWTHATWTTVVVVRFSNFWNMMAASGIQMLVSWYEFGYLSMYCGVLYSIYKVHLHIPNICNTDTRVRCKIPQFLYNIWWQLPVFRRWYRDMILVSFDTLVFCAVYTVILHILNTCNMNTRGRCKIL
jgi:hypothetical protein